MVERGLQIKDEGTRNDKANERKAKAKLEERNMNTKVVGRFDQIDKEDRAEDDPCKANDQKGFETVDQ